MAALTIEERAKRIEEWIRADPKRAEEYIAKYMPRMTKYFPRVGRDGKPWAPLPKQAAMLMWNGLEGLYGGGKMGGKTEVLLAGALQYVDIPSYSALIVRRSYAMLSKSAEGVLVRAKLWLDKTDAVWNEKRMSFSFPSGAMLDFGHMEHADDYMNYDGSRYQYIGFDQVEQFMPSQYQAMFSCLGRTEAMKRENVPLRIRSTANPRGPHKNWYKKRFLREPAPVDAQGNKQRIFIQALVRDNTHADEESFRISMANMDAIGRRQLEFGDWDAEEGGAMFQRNWFQVVDSLPEDVMWCRVWDLAASEESEDNRDPDYTVGLKMGMSLDGSIYVADMRRARLSPFGVEGLVARTAQADGPGVSIYIEQEPAGSGKAVAENYTQRVLPRFHVEFERLSGDRRTRAVPYSGAAEGGRIKLLRRDWNEEFLAEHEVFTGEDDVHDDIVTAATHGFHKLALAEEEQVESILSDGSEEFERQMERIFEEMAA